MPKQNRSKKNEPVFLVKPATRLGGLDFLHVSLIALVVILIGVAFALSTFKTAVIYKNCPGGIVNGTCANQTSTPTSENATKALQAAERVIASYASLNTTFSLLPFYTETNASHVYYLNTTKQWLVIVPYVDPLLKNQSHNMTILLYNNFTLADTFFHIFRPGFMVNESTVSYGVVSFDNKVLCEQKPPIPLYLFVDPYAPGAISAINQSIQLEKRYNNSLNVSYEIMFTNYATSLYSQYGAVPVQRAGNYLACASHQSNFTGFFGVFSNVFNDRPIPNASLYQLAQVSKFNMSSFNGCMDNVSQKLDAQATLAGFYNIITTPTYIANCKYEAIPQTVNYAVEYALNRTR
ncbi:MAG: hypothetical protein KGH98_03235 [Candidatus Micrarchaeota archaeon]|nr:hypothetical protein [Candidatus Micrarchaeota archaeon]